MANSESQYLGKRGWGGGGHHENITTDPNQSNGENMPRLEPL